MATELEKFKADGYVQPRVTILCGAIVIGAAGAVSAQTGQQVSGVTFVKNAATGRYDGTMHRGYKRAVKAMADLVGPDGGDRPQRGQGSRRSPASRRRTSPVRRLCRRSPSSAWRRTGRRRPTRRPATSSRGRWK
jgi:hypothetical protein